MRSVWYTINVKVKYIASSETLMYINKEKIMSFSREISNSSQNKYTEGEGALTMDKPTKFATNW